MIDKNATKKVSAILLKMVPYIIAIASAISAVTPNHADDELISTIKQVVNILALNVGHNANSGNPSPIPDSSSPICDIKQE